MSPFCLPPDIYYVFLLARDLQIYLHIKDGDALRDFQTTHFNLIGGEKVL